MAKKKSSGSSGIILVALMFGLAAAYKWCQENMDIVVAVLIVILLAIIVKIVIVRKKRADWIKYLRNKYSDEGVVQNILNSEFWKGQTKDQLKDSLGSPVGVDLQELKTKTKEVWKYGEQRRGQFSLKVTLENGKVVGWDQRS